MSTDDSTDVRWMTYDELAEALGITPDSARRLVNRRKWPRRQGNDGRARVGVPAERIPDSPPDIAPDIEEDDGADDRQDGREDVTLIVNVLTQHIERLEKDLEAVKSERDAERLRAAQLALVEAQHEALKIVVEAERQRVADERQRVADERQRAEEFKAERDKAATLAEASQRQLAEMIEKARAEQEARRGFFGWLRRVG